MKGKSIFSLAEAERVRELLRMVRRAERDEQKKLRNRLRLSVGFYISDFTKSTAGFTEADFDSLVKRGAIKIV
ncbi:hypothetical protein [Ralstonia holmesii]|uniref:hypothetical protein n=1 Tax=Ralstonia holmesii TaxID=3058602 RepID=UPI003F140852